MCSLERRGPPFLVGLHDEVWMKSGSFDLFYAGGTRSL